MTYRRDAVPENQEDLRRYIDNEFRKLEDETDATEVNLGLLNEVVLLLEGKALEEAILQGATTLTAGTLTNYPNAWTPAPAIFSQAEQQITYNAAAGTITIGRDGIYQVSGYVVQIAGQNGQSYTWQIDIDGVEFVIGTVSWVQAMTDSDQAFYASSKIHLVDGQVLKIETTNPTNNTVGTSSFTVKLDTLEEFV